ncbi:hypothetical protein R3P38DRAFT_3370311 [Favolaschia claudopus]|uniref:Uncharacterized protein n=1 Tax=Favolaschia claudopus TaxID=2862362 RepID=A0AAW0A0S7_9AGAR
MGVIGQIESFPSGSSDFGLQTAIKGLESPMPRSFVDFLHEKNLDPRSRPGSTATLGMTNFGGGDGDVRNFSSKKGKKCRKLAARLSPGHCCDFSYSAIGYNPLGLKVPVLPIGVTTFPQLGIRLKRRETPKGFYLHPGFPN